MKVNKRKTISIPLWPGGEDTAREEIRSAAPEWFEISIQDSATYLGCLIGPGKSGSEWSKAIAKYLSRIRGWNWAELGLYFATLVYNTYAFSVLAFLAQVCAPSPDTDAAERVGLRRAAPGPGNWCKAEDLWGLQRYYGMPASFRSLRMVAAAAKLRVTTVENRSEGGLGLREMTRHTEQIGRELHFPGRLGWWEAWRQVSISSLLKDNQEHMEGRGINGRDILASLRGECDRGHPDPVLADKRARSQLQRTIRKKLEDAEAHPPHFRIRRKLARWRLPGRPRIVAERFERHLQAIRASVPPRVSAAVFGTAWNRWITARRFQNRNDQVNVCVLGCGADTNDSIEHYSRCKVLRRCHAEFLGINADWLLPVWLGTAEQLTTEDRTRGALGVYVSYRLTNLGRSLPAFSSREARDGFRMMVETMVASSRGTRHGPGSKRRRVPDERPQGRKRVRHAAAHRE